MEADRSGEERSRGFNGGASSSDGGYGSAKAKRPPPVYISPSATLRLSPHARSPPPRCRFPPSPRSAVEAFSSNQTYPCTPRSRCSLAALFPRPPTTAAIFHRAPNSKSRARAVNERGPAAAAAATAAAGISACGHEYSTGACP